MTTTVIMIVMLTMASWAEVIEQQANQTSITSWSEVEERVTALEERADTMEEKLRSIEERINHSFSPEIIPQMPNSTYKIIPQMPEYDEGEVVQVGSRRGFFSRILGKGKRSSGGRARGSC